jgi:hypothetical protein
MAQFSRPTWLRAMMDSRAGAAEGIRWFTPAECAASAQRRPTAFPARRFWVSDEQRAAADQGWQNTVQVGVGPDTYEDHVSSVKIALWLDTAQPDTLWAGLQGQPPFLWFPVGRDEATLISTLRPYLPTDLAKPRPHVSPGEYVASMRQAAQGPIPGPSPEHKKWERLLVGIALNDRNLTLADVENHLLMTRAVDPRFLLMGTSQDNPRINPAVTVVRTLYSRSTIVLKWFDYLQGSLFAEFYFAPTEQAETIKAFNKAFWLNFPPNVPVDVPAALLGLDGFDTGMIHDRLAQGASLGFTRLCMYLLLELNVDADTCEFLRPYIAHSDRSVREVVIRLSTSALLRDMKAIETDAELLAQIDRQIAKRSKG